MRVDVSAMFLNQVLPSEKEMKQNLMSNSVYNEYNLEDMEASFKFVSSPTFFTGLRLSFLGISPSMHR